MGTPGYMAPAVLFASNHSFQVDFFALGVIIFEFMNENKQWRIDKNIKKRRSNLQVVIFKEKDFSENEKKEFNIIKRVNLPLESLQKNDYAINIKSKNSFNTSDKILYTFSPYKFIIFSDSLNVFIINFIIH